MTFSSHNLFDRPTLASHVNVLFLGPDEFPVSYSNTDTSLNDWDCHSGSFMVDNYILLKQYEVSISRVKTRLVPVTSNRSDFTPTLLPLFRTRPLPIHERFPWSICDEHGMSAKNAYPSGNLVPSPFWTCTCSCCETIYPTLAVIFQTFHLEYPSKLSQFWFQQVVVEKTVTS